MQLIRSDHIAVAQLPPTTVLDGVNGQRCAAIGTSADRSNDNIDDEDERRGRNHDLQSAQVDNAKSCEDGETDAENHHPGGVRDRQ